MPDKARKRSVEPEAGLAPKRHQADQASTAETAVRQPLTSLLEWKPKSTFVVLDEFWFRATSLKALKDGFDWNVTPYSAPLLDVPTRYQLSCALGDDPAVVSVYGTFCFGGTPRERGFGLPDWLLYLVFPKRKEDLIEDEKLAEKFHSQVLIKAHHACRISRRGDMYVPFWDRESLNEPIPVNAHLVDMDRFWSMIQDGIEADDSLKSLKGVFLAVVWTARSPGGEGSSRDEIWKETMKFHGSAIDTRYIVQDMMHARFRDVTVASRRSDNIFPFL
ncbi:hypothetical protein LTR56_011368 [Elasticomyces elasticus]|nr:hypothetical protein LTR56_011368 [Elasticomyces elasticus]KAK3660970.1 hypothetical protein LTR22_007798 [Elasticomyces elasticus]KAK4932377.1 hypothetical protein LTR49_001246 [Elasticomyces elasticus]KAK5768385.1 hypothetical protein LTS12_001524 [Elasticomyces elasticus]